MRHVPGACGITADTGDNKTCVSLFLITIMRIWLRKKNLLGLVKSAATYYQKCTYLIAVACCDNRLTSFDEMFSENG